MTFRLDRLGRSLSHLVKTLEDLETRKIGFKTLDGVSTRGATGKLVLTCLVRSLSLSASSSSSARWLDWRLDAPRAALAATVGE
jgi:Resolvase, N terminal domain